MTTSWAPPAASGIIRRARAPNRISQHPLETGTTGDTSPPNDLSTDQVLLIVESAVSPDELRAAIGVAAAFLHAHAPDDKMVRAMSQLMIRVETAGIQFGRPHEGAEEA